MFSLCGHKMGGEGVVDEWWMGGEGERLELEDEEDEGLFWVLAGE